MDSLNSRRLKEPLLVGALVILLLIAGSGAIPNNKPPPPPIITGPLDYGAKVYSISYAQLGSATWPAVQNELTLLRDMGIKSYALHLNYDPWIQNRPAQITIVDQAVAWIKSNGGSVHIVDACCESLRNNKVTWDQMKQLWIMRITEWTTRYHPDALTTIKEPGYYLSMISNPEVLNITDVVSLDAQLTSIVKANSPTTKTVFADNMGGYVPGLPGYNSLNAQMLSSIVQDPNLDVFGIDIYGKDCGNDNKTPFLNSTVNIATSAGKKVWIAETWGSTAGSLGNCSAQSEINWAQHISEYAVSKNISTVEWFFTQRFYDSSGLATPTYTGIKNVMVYFN